MKLMSIILITAPLLQYNHWVHLMKICIGKLFSFLFIYAYAVEGYYSEQSFWKSSSVCLYLCFIYLRDLILQPIQDSLYLMAGRK